MARKKRPRGNGPGRRRPTRPAGEDLPVLPDPRALEQALRGIIGAEGAPDSPQGKAQELLDRAFQEASPKRKADLARQAIAVWPDCADAYVLLAENAPRRKDALQLYQQGVEAGERALGAQAFRRDAGRFWGLLETRPYMRARQGLAHSLWAAGRRQEAVEHLQDMLRLNPNDNQGLRYTLAGFLLFLDRDEDLVHLLEQFPDEGSATWAYTKALRAFRRSGDTPEALDLLQTALRSNKHVPEYLLERKLIPVEMPGFYSPGHESEALHYIGGFMAAWKATPGAIAWLRANDPQTHKLKEQEPRVRGPLPLVKRWLKGKLPQAEDVWQADVRRLPNALCLGGENIRPWVMLVTSRSRDLVLAHAVLTEEPAAALVWDNLVQAMQNPAAGEPHRPTQLQVRADERWQSLRPHLEQVGIDVAEMEELDQLSAAFRDMCEHVCGKPQPGLLDMPGVKAEQAAGFFEAAARFFEQAPWKWVGLETAIRVECARYPSGPWYVVLLGQTGLATGLGLYEEMESLRQVWGHPATRRDTLRDTVATVVLFGEEIDLPLSDVEAARRYDWEVARSNAWPLTMHKERGMSHRPPLAWELELLEGCLRAIPAFVRSRPQGDPTPEEVSVTLASGRLPLVLSWVQDDEA